MRDRISLRLIVCLAALAASQSIAAGPTSAPSADDPALREYLSSNGLLNRGLNELACKEYRKFLAAHGDHSRAPLARYGLGVALFRMQRFAESADALKPLATDGEFPFAAEVQVMLGHAALSQKQYAEAAAYFRAALQRKPGEAMAAASAGGLVEALYRAGKYDDALKESKRVSGGAGRQRVSLFAGLCLAAKKDDAAAAPKFEEAIRLGGDAGVSERAMLALAQCRARLHQPDEAAKHYRAILERPGSPLAVEAKSGLIAVLLESGKADTALQLMDEAGSNAGADAGAPETRLQRGQALFALKQYKKALKEFGVVAESPSDAAAAGAYWAAKCLLRLDRPVDAAERLRVAVGQYPKCELMPEMLFDRAVALSRAERAGDALTAMDEFRKQFPDHELAASALQLLADLNHQQRRYDRSLAACNEYLKVYGDRPERTAVEFLVAENQFLAGDMAAAADSFSRYLAAHSGDPSADKARFRLGLAYFRQAKLDEARTALAPIVEKAADDAALRPALRVLADIAFQRSEWKTAEDLLQRFLAADGAAVGADQALLMLGLSRARQARWKDAVPAYDHLLKQFEASPNRLQAEFERGQALMELGDIRGAKASFERVLAEGGATPFAAHARNHLASIAAKEGDSRGAAEMFAKVAAEGSDPGVRAEAMLRQAQTLASAGKDGEAEAALRRFLKDFPDDARHSDARARLAIAAARQNRCKDALPLIDAALNESGAKLATGLVDALQYEKAWCLRSLNRNDEAAAAYRPLAEGGAGALAMSALLESAEIELNAGRPESALKMLRTLRDRLAADPDHASSDVREQAAYRLAVCEYQLKHMAEAEKCFAGFVSNYPKSRLAASASYFAGECAFQSGRHADAFRFLKSVVADGSDVEVIKPALLRLGDAAAALQRWSESEQAFASWLERFARDEGWFQAQFGIGWALENQGQHKRAITAYRKVVESHQGPTAARAQFQIGECLFAMKRYDDASAELLKVDILYAYPDWSAAALFEAGRCFEQLGKTAEAREQFKSVHEKYRATRWSAMADERLTATAAPRVPGH